MAIPRGAVAGLEKGPDDDELEFDEADELDELDDDEADDELELAEDELEELLDELTLHELDDELSSSLVYVTVILKWSTSAVPLPVAEMTAPKPTSLMSSRVQAAPHRSAAPP